MVQRTVRVVFLALIFLEASGALGVVRHDSDFTWVGLIATLVFIWHLLERLRAPGWLWVVALVMLLLDAASAVFLLYSRIGPWDRLMHTLGGAAIAAGVRDQVDRAFGRGDVRVVRRERFTLVSVYLLVAAIGFAYEFLEYLVDRLWFGYPKTLVSAYNSVEDQLFNLLGATLVLAAFYLWERSHTAARTGARFTPSVAHASEREGLE